MIIKTNYASLMQLLDLMNQSMLDKTIQENLKVVNFFVQNNQIHAICSDNSITCMDILEGEYDLEGETNPFMCIPIKEMLDNLNKYSSLQRTEVKEVRLSTLQNGVEMTVIEDPKVLKDNVQFQFSDKYKHIATRNKLTRYEVKSFITNMIPDMVLPDGYIEMQSVELRKYLDYIYPPMSKTRGNSFMSFDDELVFSIIGNLYGVAMPNKLPLEIFSNLRLSSRFVKFLQNVVSKEENFKVYKDVTAENASQIAGNINQLKTVSLIFQIGSILVKLKMRLDTGKFDTQTFRDPIENWIEIDKPYFLDAMKRIDGYDTAFIEINIREDENLAGVSQGEFIIKTQKTYQVIPVIKAQGSGQFTFALSPDHLGLITFNHLTKDMDGNTDKINDLILCMKLNTSSINSRDNKAGSVSLSCRDKTDDWQTRYPSAPVRKAPLLDF